MISATLHDFNDMVDSKGEEIILSGKPTMLKGKVTLFNKADEMLVLKDIPLSDGINIVTPKGDTSINALPVNALLNAAEERTHNIIFQLHPQTPPGVYETKALIGGTTKKLKIIVEESINVQIEPKIIDFFNAEPGKTYNKELLLKNDSNIAITIHDNYNDSSIDLNCLQRSLLDAIREKGMESFNAMMDELTKNIYEEVIDSAEVRIEETGNTIEPGISMPLHLIFTLPENAKPDKDYVGKIRLWDTTITYRIKSDKIRTKKSMSKKVNVEKQKK